MKNSLPAILLPAALLVSAFLPRQTAQQQTVPQAGGDSGRLHYLARYLSEGDTIRQLIETGLYDSAISRCAADRAAGRLSYATQEMALACAYWHKGDKSRAYQYVQHDADYQLRLHGGSGDPFQMLYDYSFGDALAGDPFLEQVIADQVAHYYAQKMAYYPERNTGLKLMLLDYEWKKTDARYAYSLGKCADATCRENLHAALNETRGLLADKLRTLINDNNGKLYTERDIGPAAEKQFTLLGNSSRPADQVFAEALLRKALEDQQITPDTYVYRLLSIARNAGMDAKRLFSMQDSLCRMYKCRATILDTGRRTLTFYDAGNETPVNADSFYRPAQGAGIDSLLKEAAGTPGKR